MLLPIPTPEPEKPKGPIIHVYQLVGEESTEGGYKFHGIKYEGDRPITAYDDSLEAVKARLK